MRREVILVRDGIHPDQRSIKEGEIEKRLIREKEFIFSQKVMLFASFRSEPATFSLIEIALSIGKTVVLPRVNAREKGLVLYKIDGLAQLTPGYRGIPEPGVPKEGIFNPAFLDLIILPGVAFDTRGGRLGYGGGYYDRLISRIEARPPLIAIAFEEQIIDNVPVMDHDIRVDKIVTDRRTIIVNG